MRGGKNAKRPAEKVEHLYGALRLRCELGHELGFALVQEGRYSLSDPRRCLTLEGDTLRASCGECLTGRRRTDLQAAWSKIAARLDVLAADRHADTADYVLGGLPLH